MSSRDARPRGRPGARARTGLGPALPAAPRPRSGRQPRPPRARRSRPADAGLLGHRRQPRDRHRPGPGARPRRASSCPTRAIAAEGVPGELDRLDAALDAARRGAESAEADARERLGPQYADILGAHARMIADPSLRRDARAKVEREGLAAEHAVRDVLEGHAAKLEALKDAHLAARAADVRDIARRILDELSGGERPRTSALSPETPSLALAHDLSPSQTAGLDPGLDPGVRHRGRRPHQPHGHRRRGAGDPGRRRPRPVPRPRPDLPHGHHRRRRGAGRPRPRRGDAPPLPRRPRPSGSPGSPASRSSPRCRPRPRTASS